VVNAHRQSVANSTNSASPVKRGTVSLLNYENNIQHQIPYTSITPTTKNTAVSPKRVVATE
jgi:hypothetical protein